MNKEQDFKNVKQGDRLWSIHLGDCEVCGIDSVGLRCTNKFKEHSYFFDGKYFSDDNGPSLFWSNPNIQIPERPKRKVIKTIERWANIYERKDTIIWHDKDSADRYVNENRIACVKLTGSYEIEE